ATAGTAPGPARSVSVRLSGPAPASGAPVIAAPAPAGAPVATTSARSATGSPRSSGTNDSATATSDRADRVENRFGFLRVSGTGEVRVDGRYLGAAPLVVRVPVGLHLVTLTVDGRPLAPGSYPVAITEGDTSTARLTP
ncbi:MAG TPA: hypothetical protein VFY16_03510, partial [Gemmatimonadaceae bacterium]|nr:hypothetical protein [Gemmatimonadaceae bacterium]